MAITNPIEKLIECHDHILAQLSLFNQSLNSVEQQGVVGFLSERENIKKTFEFIDTSIMLHTRDEEEGLFPMLQPKLEAKLIGSGGGKTPVDMMESEHRIVEEVTSRVKSLASMIEKSPHESETSLLLDEFLQKGRWIIQAYQGHIWKENNVLFPMAERLLSVEERKQIAEVMNDIRKLTVKT